MTSMSKWITIVTLVFLVAASAGCVRRESARTPGSLSDWSHVTVDGAGASFPYPIYSHWAYKYEELTGLRLNYQSVGSGAGISSIQQKTVDFGASDAPLRVEELDQYGLIQFPMIIGGVVPVINVRGIAPGQLRIPRSVLPDIYLGKVTQWNDEAIATANPGVELPDKPITVVQRADGSGTTWIFTSYLSAVSTEWADRVGAGKSVEWPTGVGGRGNEGVANLVGTVDDSIGYVEYAYALQNNLTYVLLENRDGAYVAPTADSFGAAASNADWASAPGYYMVLVDQAGEGTWPIVGASFILIYKDQDDHDTARAMLEFFDWCLREGKADALELDYVPVPDNVVEMIEQTWRENVTSQAGAVWQ
jgi:phosphate transport system substrate-binding protein